jgi:DNA-3-methyladenine glycosylase
VLIRGLLPGAGLETMRRRRGRADAPARLTNGPAKLAQALGITGRLNGHDLCAADSRLFIEAADPVPDAQVRTGPRIGLNHTPEPWKSRPWNFTWATAG